MQLPPWIQHGLSCHKIQGQQQGGCVHFCAMVFIWSDHHPAPDLVSWGRVWGIASTVPVADSQSVLDWRLQWCGAWSSAPFHLYRTCPALPPTALHRHTHAPAVLSQSSCSPVSYKDIFLSATVLAKLNCSFPENTSCYGCLLFAIQYSITK